MGGMGFIKSNESVLMYNNTMISFNMLEAARCKGVKRYFYSSSACVYNDDLQLDPGENHNILTNHPDVEKRLLHQLIQIVTSGSTREMPNAANDTPPWADLVWLPR